MRKVVLADLGKIEFQEVPLPEVKTGWVRVKILRNGLCGTDVHNYYKETIFGKDRYPFNMGHECCGIVDAIGDEVKNVKPGDMVVVNPYWTCGQCEPCLSGYNNNCDHLTTIGLTGPSGNSEYTVAPAASVLKARSDIDPTILAFTEPLGTVVYAMDKLKFSPLHDVLIIGAGSIGLLFFQMLKNAAINSLTVADAVDEKLEFAKSLGAKRVINPVKEVDPQKYDIIIDCTGSARVAESNVDRAKFGGQILIFGVCPIDSEIKIKPFDIYRMDLMICATFALNYSAFQRALHLIENDRIDVRPLLAGVYPVGQLEECIQQVHAGKISGKVIIDCTRME